MIGKPSPVPLAELRAVVAHVRALECAHSHAKRSTSRTHIWTYAAFLLILLGSIRVGAPRAYLHSSPGPNQESRMRTLQNLGVVSSIALAASVATAQNAVQWRVEDGGNGHWYEVRSVQPLPSTVALQAEAAQSIGADLATIQYPEENSHILAMLTSLGAGEAFGVWIGLRRGAPGEDWHWTDGEPLVWSGWGGSGCQSGPYPNDLAFTGELGVMIYRQNCGLVWDDTPTAWITNPPGWWVGSSEMALLLEWSADCNSDGIVDHGQIRAGELADTNANNIPDCCESAHGCNPCRADIDQSGAVNGVDLAAILNNWGTSGGKQPRSDVNSDGIVDGADLAEVLNSWGTCP